MIRLLFVLALAIAAMPGRADELFATSIRSLYNAEMAGIECSLYSVDSSTGASKLVAPLRIDGTTPIAIVSLAIHPVSGVLYGVTAGLSIPRSLVSIDAETGNVAVIGPLGHVASDLSFARSGQLFAWLPEANRLGKVDLGSGTITPMEPSGIQGVMGGGMAIGDDDVAYVAATGASGTLDLVDTGTGRGTTGPSLAGAPYLSAITNLTFSPQGVLYAVNSNMGAPAITALVKIEPATGKVTEIGRLPSDSHALIVAPIRRQQKEGPVPVLLVVLGVIAASLLGVGIVATRRAPQGARRE